MYYGNDVKVGFQAKINILTMCHSLHKDKI